MKTVSIHDAKTNLSKYIAAAKKGEKIYIGGFGKPEVVLTRLSPGDQRTGQRDFSSLKGLVAEIPGQDAFDPAFEKTVADLMLNDDSANGLPAR